MPRLAAALLLTCLGTLGAVAPHADTRADETPTMSATPVNATAAADPTDRGDAPEHASKGGRSRRELPGSPSANEADAMHLVQQHLPELTKLLETLRVNSPEQYDRAIADLARHARRLGTIADRDPQLFEIELEILKRQTRVDLLVAKLQLRDDAKLRTQLRRSVAQLHQARLARLAYDRDQARQRLARAQQQSDAVDARWKTAQSKAAQWVEQHYRTLLRRAARAEPAAAVSDSTQDATDASPAVQGESAAAPSDDKPNG